MNLSTQMKKRLSLTLLTFLPLFAMAQYGQTIRTGRPGQSIGGFAVGRKVVQLQTGYNFNRIDDDAGEMSVQANTTVLRLGITEHFEISGLNTWQTDRISQNNDTRNRSGVSSTQIGGRINLLTNKGIIPTLGLQGRLILHVQSEPYKTKNPGSKFILATVNKLTENLSLNTNLILLSRGDGQGAEPLYIINFLFSITKKLGVFVEMYGSLQNFTANYDGGLSYIIGKDLQLDASAGWQGQDGVTNWFVDAGFSYRIDWRD